MKQHPFIAVLIIAAGLWAYHNSFEGPLIFDDMSSILGNPTIRHLWPLGAALTPPHKGGETVEGRPIVNLSLAINYAINGLRVGGYHAVNLAIHIAAGLVLFGVVRLTLLQPRLRLRFGQAAQPLALIIAVVWVVHPLQTESVTYIIQRAESMMGLFYLLTLYCAIRGAESDSPNAWYIAAVGSCLLGMASKEVMVSAPLIMLLYDRAFMAGSFREAWWRRRSLYFGLGATWICLAWQVVSAESFGITSAIAKSEGISWWAYLLAEPGVIVHYLRLSLWPEPLCFDYLGWPVPGSSPRILLSAVIIVVLLGATVWACRTNPNELGMGRAWGFLGSWFFLILAPTSSFIPLDSPAYEHRMYLPLAAVITMVVVGLFVLGRRLRWNQGVGTLLGCAATASVMGMFTFLTIQRNRDYRSELTIWRDAVEKRPDNYRAHNNLGSSLEQAGQVREAINQYEQALRIRPHYVEAHNNLGTALMAQGRLPEAISHFEQALRIQPHNGDARNNLGNAFMVQAKLPEAISQYEQTLQIDAQNASAQYNLGNALFKLGKFEEAMEHWRQALRLKPDHAKAHYNLGSALEQAGRLKEAIEQYEQALRIKPSFVQAENALARARAAQ